MNTEEVYILAPLWLALALPEIYYVLVTPMVTPSIIKFTACTSTAVSVGTY